ncbi:MAG TPA: 50S ribosomal protein L1 [Kiritimatiellia bacterium]|jgi:large subunit ribosomal protein L1|nr:50S ribosomal protein L1 [Kiritimatiellia bacterium]HOM58641.1 50S ribosomal protein L1 [Kiritimatiellia bacterium]HOR97212.1 50S ribosomal protein L1 [Kiritimatiellia bacterium]HRU19435.1 50S ribosomal protein L1 [Kiritimatiellia bacterium]
MAKHGKRYVDALKKAPQGPVSLEEAVAFVKANPGAKFDETVEVAMRLGVDIRKSDQTVRGTVTLPHGSGKKVRVVVFAAGNHADEAKAAGADEVGYEDLIEKVKNGWTDFDVAIATTDAMKEVRKIARVLGPRGLMPNPKTGTVTDDTAAAVKAAKGGKVDFRMDRTGNVCVLCGKRSFDAEKLVENIKAVVDAVRAERPAGAKGTFIRSLTVSATMGVGVRVLVKEAAE